MIAIDPKVLYCFEVRVCEESFAKREFSGFSPFGVNQRFLLTLEEKKYPTIQANANLYNLCSELKLK